MVVAPIDEWNYAIRFRKYSTHAVRGRYTILNLPPGRYTVTVEAATKGFEKYEKPNVDVNLSRTSSVDVELKPAQVGGVVNITDTSGAAVDVTANTSGSNVSTEQFSN